eukprot:GABV01007270.1.p1 GENE.GABV01007270.1~~GABV01007270.1.p1  ORF type:complete len:133 (+),score=55.70 GABV01007270.1:43-399(+)
MSDDEISVGGSPEEHKEVAANSDSVATSLPAAIAMKTLQGDDDGGDGDRRVGGGSESGILLRDSADSAIDIETFHDDDDDDDNRSRRFTLSDLVVSLDIAPAKVPATTTTTYIGNAAA